MKKTLSAVAAFISIFMLSLTVVASADTIWILAEKKDNVETSAGLMDLPVDAQIGGTPTGDYVILDADTEFETTSGTVIIDSGERIWCGPEPGTPNPCGAS